MYLKCNCFEHQIWNMLIRYLMLIHQFIPLLDVVRLWASLMLWKTFLLQSCQQQKFNTKNYVISNGRTNIGKWNNHHLRINIVRCQILHQNYLEESFIPDWLNLKDLIMLRMLSIPLALTVSKAIKLAISFTGLFSIYWQRQ